MTFKIYIAAEKLEKFYQEAIREYEKRLSRYCKLSVIAEKSSKKATAKEEKQLYTIRFSSEGKLISSEALAEKIKQAGLSGNSRVKFIISGGETDEINPFENMHEELALSRMDIGTGLMAVVLMEQLYRAFKIINHEIYHK